MIGSNSLACNFLRGKNWLNIKVDHMKESNTIISEGASDSIPKVST